MADDTYNEAPEIFSKSQKNSLSPTVPDKHSPKHSHQLKVSFIFLSYFFNSIIISLGRVLREKDRLHRDTRVTGLMPLDMDY